METSLLFFYLLSSMVECLSFSVGTFEVKPVYIVSILLFLPIMYLSKKTSRVFLISKKYICLFSIFLLFITINIYISINKLQSIKMLLILLFNLFIASLIYKTIKDSIKLANISNITFYSILLLSFVCFVQFIFSVLGLYEPFKYGVEGYFNLGRPTGTLIDPGWCSVFIVGILGLYTQLWRKRVSSNKRYALLNFLCVFISLINLSRIATLLIFSNLIYVLNISKKIKIVVIATVVLLIFLLIPFMNERFYYDIVDLDKNPRLLDVGILGKEIFEQDRLITGFGIGSVVTLNEKYPWREFGANHNFFPLSILFESGIIGVIFSAILMYKFYMMFDDKYLQFHFLQFMTINSFHNSINKQYFWIIIAIAFIIDRRKHYFNSIS